MPDDPLPVPNTPSHSEPSLSEPTIERNQREQASGNDQEVPARQQREGADVDSAIAHPSPNDDQWHEEQKRYWERQIRVSKWLNWITVGGGIVALGGLIAVYAQLQMMKTSLRTTERAWVTIQGPKLQAPLAIGEIPSVYVRIQNSGRSPALKVKLRHSFGMPDMLAEGPMPPEEPPSTDDESSSVIAPGEYQISIVPFGSPLTEEYLAHLKKGESTVFTYGTVTYFDIFDVKHQTNFCLSLQDITNTHLSRCVKWNDAN